MRHKSTPGMNGRKDTKRRPGSGFGDEKSLDGTLAISKGPPHLRSDEERVHHAAYRFKANFIFDPIEQASARNSLAIFCGELMPVMPASEWAFGLYVRKKLVQAEANNLCL